MAEGVAKFESTISYAVYGQVYETPPGSKSVAWNQSNQVNVGDPDSSSVMEVLADKCDSEGAEMAMRKSDGS